ncbi:MAG: hypothetical protein ACKPJF_24020, partial [Dolichospermum sp.]
CSCILHIYCVAYSSKTLALDFFVLGIQICKVGIHFHTKQIAHSHLSLLWAYWLALLVGGSLKPPLQHFGLEIEH